MSAAQRHFETDESTTPEAVAPPPFELTAVEVRQPADLKQQVAERLAAHRARRDRSAAQPAHSDATAAAPRRTRGRSAEIAAAVAERYAHSQSYRAFLASEAERAVHQAEAAAQVASISAHAIAVAQQQLLADLDDWDDVPEMPRGPVAVPEAPLAPVNYSALLDHDYSSNQVRAAAAEAGAVHADDTVGQLPEHPLQHLPVPPVTVRHFEPALAAAAPSLPPSPTRHEPFFDYEESYELDEEIAFRHNPSFQDPGQPEDIAANLIEFPRQLVAPRKARPRIAEGPLRAPEAGSDTPALRIFEVESEAAATEAEIHSPVWESILLSARPASEFVPESATAFTRTLVPQVARLNLRVMAALVDACIIVAVQLVFTAVFVLALTHLSGREAVLEIPRMLAIGGSLGTLVVLGALYQALFFSLSNSTPGMRYARVGLCTFADENPTRRAMQLRVFAMLVATAPLGLGLIWALLDEDSLGWHDRISKMYQRAY